MKLALKSGFTIIELLVVIVVIGILAAITMISYTGVTNKATIASVTSDLDNSSKQLKLYFIDHGSYPTSLDANNCPLGSSPSPDTRYCLKTSSGNTLNYSSIVPTTFRLISTKGTTSYSTTNSTSPSMTTTVSGSTTGSACPAGFIPVPGSGTYGTNDFCVMKYEAKIQGNDIGNQTYSPAFVPESRATGSPWVSISQTDAITESQTVCVSGCHLITEAEWMTIAQNVLSVSGNWNGGVVGTSYIYSWHNDNSPANSLAAAADSDPYNGTGQSSPSNQKRTLTLTNGEVIWDMSGNASEWTNATINGNSQPGLFGESAYTWKQWNNGSLLMNGLPPTSQPVSVGITGITDWSSTQGIGQLYSNYGETNLRSFFRGGYCNSGSNAGVLRLGLSGASSIPDTNIGFRVVM